MKETKYWKGLPGTEDLISNQADSSEFGESTPQLDGITESISTTAQTGRRDFLKMLGFSVTAATVAASCKMPVKKSIPYIFKPEEITPGMANYYSSAYVNGGDFVSVLVKTREGRPILAEGNNLSTISQGGMHAQAVASVLNLYSLGRTQKPMIDGKASTWKDVDTKVTSELSSISASGGKIVLLTGTIISPTTKKAIADFKAKYPTAEHIQYDAISYSGLLDANQKTFGLRAIPNYRFDAANLIVSIGADFLGTWISPVEYAADYAKNRKVSPEVTTMNRHIQIESMVSLSGSNADKRVPVKPSDEVNSVINLYNAIASKAGLASVSASGYSNKDIDAVADELWNAKGKSLVVCGSNNTDVQCLVNGINSMLGNYGATILWDRPSYQKQGDDTAVANLVNSISSVKAIIMAECNPVYTLADGAKFGDALSKTLSIYLGERRNETSEKSKIVAATNHYLESWGDAEPKAGVIATQQPTISPLFDTRQYQESLLVWAGNTTPYVDYMQANWATNIMPTQSKYSTSLLLWDNTIHDGEIVCNNTAPTLTPNFADMATSATNAKNSVAKRGAIELKLYENVGIGTGLNTDNPWLLELPDPITKCTWENYLVTGASDEKYFHNPDHKEFKIANVTVGGVSFKLPIYCLPGVPAGVFAVSHGFGRTVTANAEFQHGVNVYNLLKENTLDVKIELTSEVAPLGCTQIHHLLTHKGLGGYKTRHIIKETTLDEYKKDNASENVIGEHKRKDWIKDELVTLYPGHTYPGHHWKMVIDLNSCIGCAACVVACTAENNVSVVGRDQVIKAREMHWLRIDKYYTGDDNNPQVTFQPMMCQHCDNAPCENVCPVAATNHSTEGINQMAYNRCIGTRYCANNCPYKVRRFNWYDYADADSFDKKYYTENIENIAEFPQVGMNEPLTRMILNPDVTVRSRGVIEKCSMCAQRLQAGKLEAKKAGEPLKDGAIRTACQNACPTNAIQFGDYNNKESLVSNLIDKDERVFGVIEEIHTLPNVMYMTKVRNKAKIDEFSFPENLLFS